MNKNIISTKSLTTNQDYNLYHESTKSNILSNSDNYSLICSLEAVMLTEGDFEIINMLEKQYEKALIAKGFNLERIYQLKDGTFKTKAPIQVHKKERKDILKALYYYYYPKKLSTFADIYVIWIEYYEKKLVDGGHRAPDTLRSYKRYYNSFIKGTTFGKKEIEKIYRSDLKTFYIDITAGQKISLKTLNNLKCLMNAVFEYASDDLHMNVISPRQINTKSLILKEVDNSQDVYTKEEQIKLMTYARKKMNKSVYARAISLMGRLDIRMGEVKAMRWSDINWDDKSIYVHDEIVPRKVNGEIKEISVGHTKSRKKSGNRYQPLTPQAIEVLKIQKIKNPDSEFIFVTDKGEVLKTDSLDHALARYCMACEITYHSSHKLRFFANTEGLNQGASLEQMQKMSGHETSNMTQHYDRRLPDVTPAVDAELWERVADVPECTLD